jgi:hypothetical protein
MSSFIAILIGAGAVLVVVGLLAAYRWARPPIDTLLPDEHGRTREQTREIELIPGLTVNNNRLFP